MQMQMRRAQPAECIEARDWLSEHHYLDEKNAIFVCVLEFWSKDVRIGAMILGSPHAPGYDRDRILQLYRAYFVEGTDPFVESRGLAMMRKYVRVWYPGIRLLLSYSDPSRGHRGTIYEADGWCALGKTKRDRAGGWSRHEGREKKPMVAEPKIRWVRTP